MKEGFIKVSIIHHHPVVNIERFIKGYNIMPTMGIHFDALVEFTKRHVNSEDSVGTSMNYGETSSVKENLEEMVRGAALFEFPLLAEEIIPESGKAGTQYAAYLRDYFDLSQENGSFLVMPFKITAIEDEGSVVILQHSYDNTYLITTARSTQLSLSPLDAVFYGGAVTLQKPRLSGKHSLQIRPFFDYDVRQGRQLNLAEEMYDGKLQRLVVKDYISFIQQLVYIMDPENFIIRKESEGSKKHGAKKKKSKKRTKILRKTTMRPHYVCSSAEGTRQYFAQGAKDSYPPHPVRGHWRQLVSERYKRMKGKKIFVPQYWTGRGNMEAEGWSYQVMIKSEFGKLAPYDQQKPKEKPVSQLETKTDSSPPSGK